MKIKYFSILGYLIFFLFMFFSKQTNAQSNEVKMADSAINENKIDVNIETNYMRRYLWRSILFGNDNVCQPLVGITYKKWSLNLGANINYIPQNVPKESYTKPAAFDEQDIEVKYSDNVGKLNFEIKADMYIYFHQINAPSTTELCIKVGYPVYKNVTAFSENVVDLNAYNAAYYNNTGLIWGYTKNKTDFSLQASVGMGNAMFNQSYFGGETSGIFYCGGKAEVTQRFNNFYIKVSSEHNIYNKEEIKLALNTNQTSNFTIAIGKYISIRVHKKNYKQN